MAKEELKLQLMKWHNKMSAKFGFDMEDTSEFSELMKQLDEPKKVVIPEFIANDIKYHKKHSYTLLGALGSTFDQRLESDVYCWFFADDGSVKKYINAWNNGYEVEKEKKYLVKIKGICQENQWLNYEVGGDILYFELNSSTESEKYKTYFTKQWLKDHWSEYEAYNNAGLLEFREAEDD
ncbi:hypothetical protein S100892_01331 [Pediococcus pentosaceus]|uniref:DUF1642 domain-containing protein n=1 Tax=Pediococcus pentosaceus TaxID=1255 RepID=A0A1Y0VTB8_PEDPE|nr:hypothetical protein S100892_01331 [Pediococcus pentosaceus]